MKYVKLFEQYFNEVQKLKDMGIKFPTEEEFVDLVESNFIEDVDFEYFEDHNSGAQCQNREECIAKYGKSLFGKKISWFKWFPWAEENNEIENLIIKSIGDFTNMDYGKRLSPELVNKLKELSKCISVYPSVLKPSDNPIYRGTGISLRELLKYDISDDLTIPKYIYKPNSPISSWSTNSKISSFFSNNNNNKNLDDFITNLIFENQSGAKFADLGQYDAEELKNILNKIFDKDGVNRTGKTRIASGRKIIEGNGGKITWSDFLNMKIGVIMKCEKPDNTFLFNSEKFKKLSSMPGEDELLKITNDPIQAEAILIPIGLKTGSNKRCYENAKIVLDTIKSFI